MQMIDKGHYILPAFYLPWPWENPGDRYYEGAIKKAAALNIPISFVATQWESLLYYDAAYLKLPADQNPNVIGLDGSIRQKVDPFGPDRSLEDGGEKMDFQSRSAKAPEVVSEPSFGAVRLK